MYCRLLERGTQASTSAVTASTSGANISLYVEFGSLSPFYVLCGANLLGIDLFDRLGFRIVEASSGLVVQSVRGLDRKAQWSDVFSGLGIKSEGFLSLPDDISSGSTGTYSNRCVVYL